MESNVLTYLTEGKIANTNTKILYKSSLAFITYSENPMMI